MSVEFDGARYWDLYERQLKPVFARFKPVVEYDARNEFYLWMLAEQSMLRPGVHVVDVGCGLSAFGPVCRAAGLRVTLVDDFGGGGGVSLGQPVEDIPHLKAFENELGLEIVRLNVLHKPLPFADNSVEVVTCFHSLEHWHNSPKPVLQDFKRVLKPGGYVILATPNAVNVRKRLYVLMGRTNYPRLEEWYYEGDPVFRGHVREPVMRDLWDMMAWSGFETVAAHGRNFIGRRSHALGFLPGPLVNAVAAGSDKLLRLFPTLCSDLHVVGRKPAKG